MVRLSGFIITPHANATRLPRPRGCSIEILDGTNSPSSLILPLLRSFLLVKGFCVSLLQRLLGFIHVSFHRSNSIWRTIYSCICFLHLLILLLLFICPGRIYLLFCYLHSFMSFFPANSTIVVTPPPPMLLCTSSPKFSERPPLPFISYRVISLHLHTIACHINQLHSTFQTLIFYFSLISFLTRISGLSACSRP